jgi:hypothetical protein
MFRTPSREEALSTSASFIVRVPSTSSKSRQLKSQPTSASKSGFHPMNPRALRLPSKRTSFVATAVPGFPVIHLRPGAPFQSTLEQLSLLRSPGSNCVSRPCSIPKNLLSEDFVPGPLFLEAFRSTDCCRSYHLLMCDGFSAFVTSQVSFSDGRGCKLCVCVCVCVCGSVGTENL